MLPLGAPQAGNLLDLPPELLQEILLHCTTASFLQYCLTCRTIYEIGSSCREVILSHLHRVPGLKASFDTLSTKDLFLLLKKRTAQHLYGANFHSDITNFIFKRGIINNRASALRQGHESNVALVEKGGSRVLLYSIENGEATLLEVLEAPYDVPGRVEIIKVVFSKRGSVAVLQKYEPIDDPQQSKTIHPFVKEAMKPFYTDGVHLVIYHPRISSEDKRRVTFGVFPEFAEYYPTAFSLDTMSKVVVAWQHKELPNARKVVLHTSHVDVFDDDGRVFIVYDDQVLLEQTSLADGVAPGRELTSIVHLDLNDHASQALVYNPASAIYNKFIALPQPHQEDYSARLSSNYCRLALGSRNAHFSVAIPFYSTHKTIAERGRCHWKYLALGIASLPRSNATVACLLRSEAQCRSFQCNHQPNLDRGRRFDRWTVMARLLGYRWSNDSLAGVTATSPQGKRLAIACWKEINVWPLNPEVIIEGPAGKDWEYYPDDAKRRHGQVRIPPVVLKPDAVVFSMCFSRDEDELIALTDKGVMRWALGPANHGFKVKKMLDMGEKSNMDEHETGKLEDTDMTDVE